MNIFLKSINVQWNQIHKVSFKINHVRLAHSVFDRNSKLHHKNIAAAKENHFVYDYLRDEVARRVADRVSDVARSFPVALDIGSSKGFIARHLDEEEVPKLYQLESSEKLLNLSEKNTLTVENVCNDEETLPFNENTFDLVVSSLSMHWVNDLPGVFSQIHKCLKPDGVFISAMFGSDTLFELRCSLQVAELEREGGFGPHISPFTQMSDIGSLLQRAGFTLTTIDYDNIVVDFPSIFELMEDLKGMGENNAAWKRKLMLQRNTLFAASSIYKEIYGNEDGSIPATFQVFYCIGWKPDMKKEAQKLAKEET